MPYPHYRFSVAPMMSYTDRHFRYMLRLMSKHALLYTEMVHANAIVKGNRDRHLAFSAEELPLSLQLGGDNPELLAEAAAVGEQYGYSEINLNVGCPSDRVQNGNFGACLMATPPLVAEMVLQMKKRVRIPVTVKHRIGINGRESYEELEDFAAQVISAGTDRLIVHARIAILEGLSPAENRQVPPLRYEDVYKLKEKFKSTPIEINGGIRSPEETLFHFDRVDGAMLGRAVIEDPWIMSEVDEKIYGEKSSGTTREDVVRGMIEYQKKFSDAPPYQIGRHLLELYRGLPGARGFRRTISEELPRSPDFALVIEKALEKVHSVRNV